MKTRFLHLLKTALIAFLIWFGLTGIFVFLDNTYGLSESAGWFPVVGVALPIFLAAFYIARSFYKKPPSKGAPAQKHAPAKELPVVDLSPVHEEPKNLEQAMAVIDAMDGHDFEQLCAEILERDGYKQVHVTKGTGDQGVDIVAVKNGVRYAFQCKRYASKLGNGPVQEVNAGKRLYSCQVGVVITNNYFTRGAETAAKATGVQLWDRDTLIRKLGW